MFNDYPRVRLAIYLLGIASQIVSFFVTGDLSEAFQKTGDVLAGLALATAATNISDFRKPPAD